MKKQIRVSPDQQVLFAVGPASLTPSESIHDGISLIDLLGKTQLDYIPNSTHPNAVVTALTNGSSVQNKKAIEIEFSPGNAVLAVNFVTNSAPHLLEVLAGDHADYLHTFKGFKAVVFHSFGSGLRELLVFDSIEDLKHVSETPEGRSHHERIAAVASEEHWFFKVP